MHLQDSDILLQHFPAPSVSMSTHRYAGSSQDSESSSDSDGEHDTEQHQQQPRPRAYSEWEHLLLTIEMYRLAQEAAPQTYGNKRLRDTSSDQHAAKKARAQKPLPLRQSRPGSKRRISPPSKYDTSASASDSDCDEVSSTTSADDNKTRRGPKGQSRFKGVCITRAGKWRAVIYIGRRQKYLGVFDSEVEAAHAYDASSLSYFGKDAKLNFERDAPISHNAYTEDDEFVDYRQKQRLAF